MRHRYTTEEPVSIRQAANGFMVMLPSKFRDFDSRMMSGPGRLHPDPDLNKIFSLKNIKRIAEIFYKIKAGKVVTDQDTAEDDPLPEPEIATEELTPENNVYIFSTWQEASDFLREHFTDAS